MREKVNPTQSQGVKTARFVDRFKAVAHKKKAAVRGWYDRRGRGCLKSVVESESDEPATRTEEFLTHAGTAEFRGSKTHQPETRSKPSTTPEPGREFIPGHREAMFDLAFGPGSVSSFSSLQDICNGALGSLVSLPSTFSTRTMSPIFVPETKAPSRYERRLFGIDTPDDFDQFRSGVRHSIELDSTPTLSAEEKPGPKLNSLTVDSTPIPVGQESPKPHFKAYPGKTDTEKQDPVTFQAYSTGSKHKNGSVGYIPPTLQSGFVNGVPPVLQAAHGGSNSAQRQATRDRDGTTLTGRPSQSYTWPLVDFHKEIFLNADPSQANHSTRYQEPRIPSMEFSGRGLEDEMKTVLGNLHGPVVDKRAGQVEDRAWMSPSSPLHSTAYAREASIPGVTRSSVNLDTHPRPRGPTIAEAAQNQESFLSSDGRRVKFSEYNWPRFSDDGYTDPAEEYSRQYRRRRREARREAAGRGAV
ncbi:hypothetical protein Z517_08531 [Fonsecaea pedrosoi CBS 271.37]|uniref:Uncharacterized protein n=1 Tax=Fonsecaea pedrosoi CBS 271.37 TaxID=1442368 RepID=A0A0D2EWX5_9EURO|nr:uncharacterized protein Z517_08531 [Fonsecaea pedrosoi CBS 271.37]KIW78692.1 hypothetical protein Z517_08531 [Fonsecaea pedrosoi CBS 271.37]